MGKQTKLRQAQYIANEQALAARLRDHKRTRARDLTWRDLPPDLIAHLEPYWHLAFRPREGWRGALRLRDPDRQFLDFVRFLFVEYPVPKLLEQAWLTEAGNPNAPDFRHWYIVAGRGFSLYREEARAWLSRAELHTFLNAPGAVRTPQAALWYAVALPDAGRPKAAIRIARSRINRRPSSSRYWRSAARFLARNPTDQAEMTELISFLRICEMARSPFALEGRTLESVRRHVRAWRQYSGILPRTWAGSPIPNRDYVVDGVTWRFRQIRSDHLLHEEGRRMHHCVGAYADTCARHGNSIWSVTLLQGGRAKPLLTLGVDGNVIWQARGFGNRQPTPAEAAVVLRWAGDFNLEWPQRPLQLIAAA